MYYAISLVIKKKINTFAISLLIHKILSAGEFWQQRCFRMPYQVDINPLSLHINYPNDRRLKNSPWLPW